jgi:hypothetical protein
MSIKQSIEENSIIWLLTALLTGFLAGIGTYKSVLEIAKLEVISKYDIDQNKKTIEAMEAENKKLINQLNTTGSRSLKPIHPNTAENKKLINLLNKSVSQIVENEKKHNTLSPVIEKTDSFRIKTSMPPTQTKNNIIFRTTYSQVNVFSEPRLESKILHTLGRNSRIILINQGADNAWANIRTQEGDDGWVEAKRIKLN